MKPTDGHSTRHVHSDIAYHYDWDFRREALVWQGDYPAALNFTLHATELRPWLLQRGRLTVFTTEQDKEPNSITNPYTRPVSILGALLGQVINSIDAFVKGDDKYTALDAELLHIRLYSELVLYINRYCEAATKQLLYCTQVPHRLYGKAALGRLLNQECASCKKAGKRPHRVSLFGTLAHRYRLCFEFEGCVFEHIKLVKRLRNEFTAHVGVRPLSITTAEDSKAQMNTELSELGAEFVHMLKHLSDLENRMAEELNKRALYARLQQFAPRTKP